MPCEMTSVICFQHLLSAFPGAVCLVAKLRYGFVKEGDSASPGVLGVPRLLQNWAVAPLRKEPMRHCMALGVSASVWGC